MLVLKAEHRSAIVVEGKRWFPRETGGVLLGHWRKDASNTAEVTHVIGPGPRGRHTLWSFTPDTEWQRAAIVKTWRENPGVEYAYLGDWHTHPLGSLSPSRRDKAVAKDIAEYPEARCPAPLIVIARLDMRGRAALAAFQWRNGDLSSLPLS